VARVAVDAVDRHVSCANGNIAESTKTVVDSSEDSVSYVLGCNAGIKQYRNSNVLLAISLCCAVTTIKDNFNSSYVDRVGLPIGELEVMRIHYFHGE
jgi:hypothetical protein